MVLELRPHQLKAVADLSNGKILTGGVGSGKSATILSYYVKNESPKDIYVITTAKKRDSLDWEKEAVKLGMSPERGPSVHGKLKVDSWNNIGKYVGIEDAYFVFDEQRLVGSGSWTKAFIKIARANNWNLLSATPGDTWLDYIPVMVANNLYKNRTEFIHEHVVYVPFSKYPKVQRYTGVSTLEKYRNLLIVEMPYDRHTERIVEPLETSHDAGLLDRVLKKRWDVFEDEPCTDVGHMFRVMRKVVNSDPSRLEKTRELLQKHDKIIIFYSFNYELDILRTLEDEVEVGEWNGHRKTPIPETDRWVYLVQYVAGAEGWNCIETDAMIFWSLTYSYKNFEQAQGRIDRLNTPFETLYYYVFMSNSVIDKAIWGSLMLKEHFNETAFASSEWSLDRSPFSPSEAKLEQKWAA